jgi:anti-sigma factor ChrR (cupin superfamily)
MNVLLITTDGNKKKVTIKTFDEARQLVCNHKHNSSAEVIVLADGTFILMDEEGKLKKLEINQLATQIAHDSNSIYPSDYIVGDVLLVDDVDEFDSLPYK